MRHVQQLDDGTLIAVTPEANSVEASKDGGTVWKTLYEGTPVSTFGMGLTKEEAERDAGAAGDGGTDATDAKESRRRRASADTTS